jgi:hypothetical protein
MLLFPKTTYVISISPITVFNPHRNTMIDDFTIEAQRSILSEMPSKEMREDSIPLP